MTGYGLLRDVGGGRLVGLDQSTTPNGFTQFPVAPLFLYATPDCTGPSYIGVPTAPSFYETPVGLVGSTLYLVTPSPATPRTLASKSFVMPPNYTCVDSCGGLAHFLPPDRCCHPIIISGPGCTVTPWTETLTTVLAEFDTVDLSALVTPFHLELQ